MLTGFYVKQEKKRLGKQSKTQCEPGCKGRIIKNDTYCRCIESKLPKMSKGSIKPILVGERIDRLTFTIEAWRKVQELPKSQLVARFKEFGLDDYEIELLYYKFWDELTFGEIVKKSGWTSISAASYVFRRTLEKLRKRGFNFG